MTSIERTAYPQFKRLTSARVLHVFFAPTAEETDWAQELARSPQALFALVLALNGHTGVRHCATGPSADRAAEEARLDRLDQARARGPDRRAG
ncbi:hypothetical protein ACQP1V_22155 [Microtetraspora malaysiensis]|uniref:hypothetical protein n=1 Tax=Microtetraspora malaysiensis TaxID=161358 RepID=UPI003D8B394E